MIRPASPDDLSWLVDLGREAHGHTTWGQVAEYCPASFADTCRGLMDREDAAVLVNRRGSIWVCRFPLFFNHAESVAHEVFFYATEGGDALRRAAERWAGPGLKTLSRNDATDTRLGRLYERAGYRPVEHTYIRRD